MKAFPLLRYSLVAVTVLVSCVAVTSCTTSSGIVPMGQGAYMITGTEKSFKGSAVGIKGALLKQADEFCTKRGGVMVVTKTVQTDMKVFKSDASAEVYFKCVAPGDPVLKYPVDIQEIRE
jgi:hypothetical protein